MLLTENIMKQCAIKGYELKATKKKTKTRKGSKNNGKLNDKLQKSLWYEYLNNPEYFSDASSRKAKESRLRFRIPYEVFRSKKRTKLPIGYKILVALRILGRADCLDSISEISGISIETARQSFMISFIIFQSTKIYL